MFRKSFAAAALMMAGLSTVGCAALSSISAPADLASSTALDEKAAIMAETSYATASILGTRLAQVGLIDRERFKAADARAYAALQAVRAAYQAGNSREFGQALDQANAAIGAIKIVAEGS